MSDLDLLRQARDELRLWLRLRDRSINEKDCGSTIGGSITFCCEKHACEHGETEQLEQAVLDAMQAFTEDDLRASVKASRECPLDYPQHRETQLSVAVCTAELRRRGLEP